jgi:hypothetical protein
VFDESLKSEVCDLGLEEIIFIDFLGIENFLPNSPTKDVDVNVNSYTVGKILFSIRKKYLILFEKKFMARECKKINQDRVKIELSQYGVKNFQAIIRNFVVTGCVVFLFGFHVVLLLRRMDATHGRD